MELTEQEVREIEDVIQYHTLRYWRERGLGRTRLFQDAKQFVWVEVMKALNNGFDRRRGVKPASYIAPAVRRAVMVFLCHEKVMAWGNRYKGRKHIPMPVMVQFDSVWVRTLASGPRGGRVAKLRKVLV
jgi:hypothetical protein